MTVTSPAARGALVLAGALGVCLSVWHPALATEEATPASPVLEQALQTSEALPPPVREAPPGTPEQSLWRGRLVGPAGEAERAPFAPALGKPMRLWGATLEDTGDPTIPQTD